MWAQEGATADADALLGEYYVRAPPLLLQMRARRGSGNTGRWQVNGLLGHVFTWAAQATGRVDSLGGGGLRAHSALLS